MLIKDFFWRIRERNSLFSFILFLSLTISASGVGENGVENGVKN